MLKLDAITYRQYTVETSSVRQVVPPKGRARKAAAVPREHGGAEALPPPGGLGKRGRRYPTVTARLDMRARGR